MTGAARLLHFAAVTRIPSATAEPPVSERTLRVCERMSAFWDRSAVSLLLPGINPKGRIKEEKGGRWDGTTVGIFRWAGWGPSQRFMLCFHLIVAFDLSLF